MSSVVRTRFAPSPTGFIHLGNIRSALYPWAFAKAHDGVFILRIEDTDEARSTQAAVDVILQSMAWLGMTPDEGPHYQMQRIDRYREAVRQMLAQGLAYPCYMSPDELDALRERQMAAKVKPRYDGTWRPEPGKVLPPVPEGVAPVIRFRNPLDGVVAWQDKVKGLVEISNTELDDLVIARPAAPGQDVGTPTYNFCVVVDDIDMDITHVIRGDDHVNNTPRQINIFKALGKTPPVYAHLPTVLNEQGEKMSKRHGAKAVTQYRDEGFLPSAMVNYLARLGWSHGDEEIFTVEQFLQWFDLDHLGKSASQFDEAKLRWVNAQHMKMALEPQREHEPAEAYGQRVGDFVERVATQLRGRGHQPSKDGKLLDMCRVFVDRCSTTAEVADWLAMYFAPVQIEPADRDKHLTDAARGLLHAFADGLDALQAWDIGGINGALKAVLEDRKVKMPHLAIPVRVAVCGRAQTPDITVVLSLFDKDTVLQRLRAF